MSDIKQRDITVWSSAEMLMLKKDEGDKGNQFINTLGNKRKQWDANKFKGDRDKYGKYEQLIQQYV